MAAPRKTASKAEALRVSQIGDFKERVGGLQQLPSGLVVKVRNPGGLTAFIANGTIPNSLLNIVQDTLSDDLSKEEMVKKATDLKNDMESIGDMMQLMDIIAQQVIVEPKCMPVPTEDDVTRHNLLNPNDQVSSPADLRDDEGTLYIDEIDGLDKQFLFQWVTGGTRDLEKFRKEHERNVAAVSAKPGSADSAQPALGADNG
ncbi:MAG: hypothetical protein RR853_08995 [Aurantimicrobium sp.]|uniref:DUF7391 family protein n=1 Tax=Aurantimicrobium sp. TaxID=1930784 RepID=UPI002FCA9DEB